MKLSIRTLEKLRLGEFSDEEAAELLTIIESDETLKSEFERLQEEDETFLRRYPATTAASLIRQQIQRDRKQHFLKEDKMINGQKIVLRTGVIICAVFVGLFVVYFASRAEQTHPELAQAQKLELTDKKGASRSYARYARTFDTPNVEYFEMMMKAAELADNEKYKYELLYELADAHDANPTYEGRRFAAQARFRLAERIHTQMVNIDLNHEDETQLKSALQMKTNTAKSADKLYRQVVAYNVPELSIASEYRVGTMYVDMADAIRNSFKPGRLTADQLVKYQKVLEQSALGVERQGIEALKRATAIGEDLPESKYGKDAELLLASVERRQKSPEIQRCEDAWVADVMESDRIDSFSECFQNGDIEMDLEWRVTESGVVEGTRVVKSEMGSTTDLCVTQKVEKLKFESRTKACVATWGFRSAK